MRVKPFLLLFLLVWLLSFRFFFINSYQAIGHNWDWNFPALSGQLERLHLFSTYYWNDHNLGMALNLQSHFLVNLALSLLARVLSVKVVIILLFFVISLTAFVSYKKFIDHFLIKSELNYLPALLFAFSPFLFNEIIGGSWYMWVAYAVAPFVLITFDKYLQTGKARFLFQYCLLSFLSVVSLQNFVVIESIVFLYLIYLIFTLDERIKLLVRYLLSHFALIAVNAYWLIPFGYSSKSLFTLFTSSDFTGNFIGAINSTQDIASLFGLYGYLDRNIYLHALPGPILYLFAICLVLFWISTVFIFISNKNNLKNKIIFWVGIVLLITFIAKGANPPFGNTTLAIFNLLPILALYRSPQHLVFGMALIVPLIVAFNFHHYFFDLKRKSFLLIPLLLILIWISGWWLTGDLGSKTLARQERDHIDFYSLSPDLIDFYQQDLKSDANYRTLFLPSVCSPTYVGNEYQNEAQGGIPEYNYLKNSTICSESNLIAKTIDDYFCFDTNLDLIKFLVFFNFQNIVLRNDIIPKHTKCGILDAWDLQKVQTKLSETINIKLKSSGPTRLQYELISNERQPIIATRSTIEIINNDQEDLMKMIVEPNFNPKKVYFFTQQNQSISVDDILAATGEATVKFIKVSPVKYELNILTDGEPFILNFGMRYDQGWQLYPKSNFKNFFTNNPKAIHFVSNSYSNGWIINPDRYCQSKSCSNIDGQFALSIYLEYFPQYLFYFSALISVVSAFVLLIISIMHAKE